MSETIRELLDTMEALGPQGQRHALLEADGTLRRTSGGVTLRCLGIEVEARDDAAAVGAWRAAARARLLTARVAA